MHVVVLYTVMIHIFTVMYVFEVSVELMLIKILFVCVVVGV